MEQNNCQTCNTPFIGKFCYSCGEKQVQPADLSFSKFVSQAIDGFTHFDGKFFLTIRYLLWSPGKLTNAYLAGRRVKLMKVVQLYLVVGIVFFLLFKDWDIFFARLQYAILENPSHLGQYLTSSDLNGFERWLKSIVEQQAAKHHKTFSEMVFTIDAGQPERSKAFAFLMIPWLALSFYIVGFYREKRFVPHLVHAAHTFCFYLSTMVIWIGGYEIVAKIFHLQLNNSIALAPVHLITLVYLFFSIKNVLKPANTLVHIGQLVFVAVFGFIGMIQLYRTVMMVIAALVA